jgi:thioredoxin-like negative regulator of GroEL
MKINPAIVILVAGFAQITRAELPAGWSTNYAGGLTNAAAEHKLALVYFTATWCGPCKLMGRTTLSDPAVRKALSSLVPIATDIDEHPDLASAHQIEAVPTFVMMSGGGDEIQRTSGFQPAETFLTWLTNGISASEVVEARRAQLLQKLAEVDQSLASTNSKVLRQSASALFDLCPERNESVVRSAMERLKVLTARQPLLVLEGMEDSRLATRIQIANALRSRFGDEFDVDPWGEPSLRAAAIQKWRDRLAATAVKAGE